MTSISADHARSASYDSLAELERPIGAPPTKKTVEKVDPHAALSVSAEAQKEETKAEASKTPRLGDSTRAFLGRITPSRYAQKAQDERRGKVAPQRYLSLPRLPSIPKPNRNMPILEAVIDFADDFLEAARVGLETLLNSPAGFFHQYRQQGKTEEEAFFMTVASLTGMPVTVPLGQVNKAKAAVASGEKEAKTLSPFVKLGQMMGRRQKQAQMEESDLQAYGEGEEPEEGILSGDVDEATINTFRRSLRPDQLETYKKLLLRSSVISQGTAGEGKQWNEELLEFISGFEPEQNTLLANVNERMGRTSPELATIPDDENEREGG